ncbi:hypothetical protein [Streptomyces sp. NPDC127036]|uniref:hypothetical protein n=1 Tax=Streptomyces sp. NPDC127036 TaxID=3347112 RepID=UPI00365C6F8B
MSIAKRVLAGTVASLTLSAGFLGVTASSVNAYTGPAQSPDYWMCKNTYLRPNGEGGACWTGSTPRFYQWQSDAYNQKTISSIQTNQYAIQTWNGYNWTGTYGYFAPNYRWDVLNSPYDNAIVSVQIG